MFNRMKIYTVHVKPGTVNPYERPVFVREGFNVYAFVLTIFWTLYQRMWKYSIALFLINVLFVVLVRMHFMSTHSMGVVQFALSVLIGFSANDWLRVYLGRRGYIVADVAAGDSLLRAEQRYFERYLASAAH